MVRCEVSSLSSDRCASFSIFTRACGGTGARYHWNRRWRGATPLVRVPCICAPIMREEDALWGILLGDSTRARRYGACTVAVSVTAAGDQQTGARVHEAHCHSYHQRDGRAGRGDRGNLLRGAGG